jgi:putative ABC transport system ATP-binding protein
VATMATDPQQAQSSTNGAVVTARGVTRVYGEGDTAVQALRGVDLDVERGRLTGVMGPSGSGKSTLMHILAGLDKPTDGDVTIDGTRIADLSDTELTKLRRKHIGFVFQFFNLLPMLTAEENILERVGLSDRRTHRPAELSGGQQQRVAIARALISKPTVVFADEPTGNLDSTTSQEILDLLRESVETLGQTFVVVSHDPKATAIADRTLFLADGCIVKELGKSTEHEVAVTMEQVSRQ